jgi:hypothetical protein
MNYARIIAEYDQDSKQTLVIIGRLGNGDQLQPGAEAYGYAKDWIEDEQNYGRYPFILEPLDAHSAALSWGSFDDTKSVVDIMGRRLAKGVKLIRQEIGERYTYTIKSIQHATA